MHRADLDRDGRISFDEFQLWLESDQGDAVNALVDAEAATFTVDEMRRLTGVDRFSVEHVAEVLASYAGENGVLTRAEFFSAFDELVDPSRLAQQDVDKLRLVLHTLYNVMDTNHDGVLDVREVAAGLAMLCGGEREDKARQAFELYDYNGDGTVSEAELVRMLTSVYRLLYETTPQARDRAGGLSPEQLAMATAQDLFQAFPPGHQLTYPEFARWFNSEPGQSV